MAQKTPLSRLPLSFFYRFVAHTKGGKGKKKEEGKGVRLAFLADVPSISFVPVWNRRGEKRGGEKRGEEKGKRRIKAERFLFLSFLDAAWRGGKKKEGRESCRAGSSDIVSGYCVLPRGKKEKEEKEVSTSVQRISFSNTTILSNSDCPGKKRKRGGKEKEGV